MLPMFSSTKPKLPRFASWPLGREQLSKYFETLPEPRWPTLWYWADQQISLEMPRATLQKLFVEKTERPVLRVWYAFDEGSSACKSKDQRTAGKWYLMVYPVEKEHRSSLKQLLVDRGLNEMVSWIRRDRSDVWLASPHNLDCLFDPKAVAIRFAERER